ncbi:hypothetical protein J5N97_028037 [Dioscorea zingiberensis]|uniref:BURP domain-containing protein n=1 Tax=Dioscorea zingiberensis TaxID=325984 RepID=A0A9D5BYB4_9LILI|nr:hypothetical protein J5N97_028037 [Dioscorea zingiberensis]
MDSFLPFLSIFIVTVVATISSHAATTPGELYWNSVLPNTPMPSAIKDLLVSDEQLNTKATSVDVGNGGVHVDVGKGGVNVDVGKGHTGVHVDTGKGHSSGKGNVTVDDHHHPHKKPPFHHPSPFYYRYAASETQLHDDPNAALFFLEKDLHSRTKMKITFNNNADKGASFISREKAKSIPFSSSKLHDILSQLSIKPDSTSAAAMKKTLGECEEPGIKGEEKQCVTSLESMVEFSMAKLGTRDVSAVSTTVDKESGKQEYNIGMNGVKRMKGKRMVACHAQPYAYAVFYCHAVAVCHLDTAGWNKEHLAFKVLKVKPGSVPVCHFLPQDHVIWGPRK